MSTIFAPIRSGFVVEEAAQATLERWLPTYLAEVERQNDIPPQTIPVPASWVTENQFEQVQGAPLPCVIIVSAGTDASPERTGDGRYDMWFSCGVAVIVEALNDTAARRFAQLYAAAVAAIFVQQPSLGDVAARTELQAVTHDDAPANFLRAGCAVARVVTSVLLEGVVTALAGPSTPDLDPAEWPQVETVQIDAERRSLS
jgi:hypothetical protein